MTERKNILFGSIISYITIGIEILISIIFTPFLLKEMGDVDYGIRVFCHSLVSYLRLLTLGLSSAYFRFRKLAEKSDPESVKEFNGVFISVFIVISIIALLIGIAFTTLYSFNVISFSKFPESRHGAITIILIIMIITYSLHFPFAVLTLIISYRRKFVTNNLISLFEAVMYPILVVILIFTGLSNDLLIEVVLITFIVSLAADLIKLVFVVFVYKEKISFKLSKKDFSVLKPMLGFCLIVFISTAVSIIHKSTDQIILGTMVSATSITLYSLSVSFSSYITTASSSISSLLGPKITSDCIDGKISSVQNTCKIVWTIISILLCLIVGGFCTCGKEFILAWVGIEKSNVYVYSMMLFATNLLGAGPVLAYTIQTSLNKHKFAALVYVVCLILNILLSILLCKYIDILGVIIATIFSKLIESIALSVYTKKVSGVSTLPYWISIVENVLIAASCYGFVYLLFYLVDIRQFSYLAQVFMKGVVFTLLYCAIVFVFQRKFLLRFIRLLRHKEEPIKN